MKGVLIVNLEPSYIGFKPTDAPSRLRNCNHDEIRELLIDLGVMQPSSAWPVRELFLRLPGEYSMSTLLKYDLANDLAA